MDNFTSHIRQPLNLYSVFGYLLPGFFLVSLYIVDMDVSVVLSKIWSGEQVSFDALKSEELQIEFILKYFSTGTLQDFKFIPFLIFLLFCYLIGHIVSAFSSFFLEKLFVKEVWGFPSSILVSGREPKCPWFFGNYRRPLKSQMLARIKAAVKETFDYDVNKEDYYWLLYSYIITSRPYLAPRVHHFVNLYGFSRNMAATFVLYILFRIMVLNWVVGLEISKSTWAVLTIYFSCAGFMFWNYLKLFKRQAVDVYYLFLSIRHDDDNILFKG